MTSTWSETSALGSLLQLCTTLQNVRICERLSGPVLSALGGCFPLKLFRHHFCLDFFPSISWGSPVGVASVCSEHVRLMPLVSSSLESFGRQSIDDSVVTTPSGLLKSEHRHGSVGRQSKHCVQQCERTVRGKHRHRITHVLPQVPCCELLHRQGSAAAAVVPKGGVVEG